LEDLFFSLTEGADGTVGLAAGCWSVPHFFPLPDESAMQKLAKDDPLAFFRQCLRRYDREVFAYTCTLDKTERLDGKVQPTEEIKVSFREEPFTALLEWEKNARLAKRSLYVKGQNNDKLLALPNGRLLSLAGVVERDPEGASAKSSSRYPQTEFGIKIGTERTVAAPGVKASFPLADFFQTYLLEGLDDIALTLRHERDIAAYEARRPAWAPRVKVSERA